MVGLDDGVELLTKWMLLLWKWILRRITNECRMRYDDFRDVKILFDSYYNVFSFVLV